MSEHIQVEIDLDNYEEEFKKHFCKNCEDKNSKEQLKDLENKLHYFICDMRVNKTVPTLEFMEEIHEIIKEVIE